MFLGGHDKIAHVEPFVNIEASTLGGLSSSRTSLENLDVIIVHEGVIDAIRTWWPQNQPFPFGAFYASAPFYVRTSGRGSMSRHGGQQLPFLEFSELSDSTYQAHNKFSLGRSVLGLRGPLDEKTS